MDGNQAPGVAGSTYYPLDFTNTSVPPGETVADLGRTFTACASASTPLLTVLSARSSEGLQGVTP